MVSSSYCYSETVTGSTPNATIDGYTWVMRNILPAQAGLEVTGLSYRYTIDKDPNSDATVYIRNEHVNGGYIYEREDVWDGLPGNTKVGYDPLIPTLGDLWGNGEIGVEGDGVLSNTSVVYTYRFDPCFDPMVDPSCPGYKPPNNLLQYADLSDPYNDPLVQEQLNRKTNFVEQEFEEKQEEDEEKEELDIEKALSISGAVEKLADGIAQGIMLKNLAAIDKLNSYYDTEINGGAYEDVIQLNDSYLPDNGRLLRNLATDEKHNAMVRSQYEN